MSPKKKKSDQETEVVEGAPEGEKQPIEVSIAAHPRAKAGIRRARTRSALFAFVLVLALNLLGDQALFDAVWRALVAGIVVNIIVWRCAIVVWRHIVLAELREAGERHEERKREEREKLEKLAAARAEAQAAQEQQQQAPFRAS
jgi:hypothetical protein